MSSRPRLGFTAQIFLGYFVVLGVLGYAGLRYFEDAIKPAVRQTMEEMLAEQAGTLAEIIEARLARAGDGAPLVDDELSTAFHELSRRRLGATIYGVRKDRADERVTVCDARGVVVFDSAGEDVGRDYSQWHDVYNALRGRYGARSTHVPADGPSHLFVAARIEQRDRLVGVVTVSKSVRGLEPFVALAQGKLLRQGAIAIVVSLGAGLLLSWALSRSVRRIVAYARSAAEGKRTTAPRAIGELGVLARAVESMRARLEGRRYVEHTVQTFAHEMKSPLTAIVSAAEVLEDDLPPHDRLRFAHLARDEARRMQQIVERLLVLAVLEQQGALRDPGDVDLAKLVDAALARRGEALAAKALTARADLAPGATVFGEELLLSQALLNLVDNAIAFASAGTEIRVRCEVEGERPVLRVHDTGAQIPEFARGRIFERFYSVAPSDGPAAGRRSTGLGLAFVREVSELHGATIAVDNDGDGVTATWTFAEHGSRLPAGSQTPPARWRRWRRWLDRLRRRRATR